MTSVKEFYDKTPFPGYYTLEQLSSYGDPIENRYLHIINTQVSRASTVLDVGCGTGLISNLLALRNKNTNIVGLDFATSIDYAKEFARSNRITNVTFLKEDVVKYTIPNKFDIVLCQGVLHHIPEYQQVLPKLLDSVADNGKMILGLYHPVGKIAKRFLQINYHSDILYQDQEQNPFELSFTQKQVQAMTPGWKITSAGPSILNNILIPALFNYRSGGLVIYILERI